VQEVGAAAMARGIALARWMRYEVARVYACLGVGAPSDADARQCAELPEQFGWREVAEVWGVEKRAAHDTINRLREKGLADRVGHGQYRRCTAAPLHYLHFRPSGAPVVQIVQECAGASGGDGAPSLALPPLLTPGLPVSTPRGAGIVKSGPENDRVSVEVEGLTVQFRIGDVEPRLPQMLQG
jgi:hypothetical protein